MTTFTLDEVRRMVGPVERVGETFETLAYVRRTLLRTTVSAYGALSEKPVATIGALGTPRTKVQAPRSEIDAAVAQALRDAGYILAEDIGL